MRSENTHIQNWIKTLVASAVIMIGYLSPSYALNLPWNKKASAATNENQVQTIVIAVDGLSYTAFLAAQSQGLFKEFGNYGAHVSPFPSMTDLSWATVTKTSEIFGSAGRIKSVEATYFDESTQSIQGDPRDYYRRLAFPKYYMGAFDTYFNPYVEALMYFPTEEVPKLEIKSVIDDLIAAKPKTFLTGYVGAIDSTAHTQGNRLFPVIRNLDSEIKRLIKAYKDKGQNVEVVLVSDHGNVGRFKEGQNESELVGVDLGKAIENAGFSNVQQLKSSKDVAIPLLALGSWGPVYLKDRSQIKPLIHELRKESWFDLAVFINRNNDRDTLMTVISSNGEAKIQYDKKNKLYYYHAIQGNPLQIPQNFISTESAPKPMSDSQAIFVTSNTTYPDSIFRIIESASERNFDFPDFILTLKDGFYIQSSLGAFTKMYRTHGSLTAASSFGLLASTKRKIPGQIRSRDILNFFGVNPKDLFGDVAKIQDLSRAESFGKIAANYRQGIETKAKDLSQKRIFQHISRFVSDTRPYFLVTEMKSFMAAFKFDPFKQPQASSMSPMNFDVSKFDVTTMISPEDIGAITDAVLTSGSVENLMKDPRVEKIKDKVSLLKTSSAAQLENQSSDEKGVLENIVNFVLPAKRAVMKMYQMPYLLEKSIVVQEKAYLPDTRDLNFAKEWLKSKKTSSESYKALNATFRDATVAQNLLRENIKEADFEDRIYPTPLTKIYGDKIEDLTIVYVPGIYNSIFDKEIFSLGLNSLRDDLGLRVIQPPVESTCGAEVNADVIIKFLRNDMTSRISRGHSAPRYLVLGYSKGAVDTLHAFVKNPDFASRNVVGFVAIASPLHGSSILNTTDLPFALVSALSENQGPKICQTDKTAAKSITPTALASFWRKNERSLIGLTRYFSVTFESDPEDSHIFMKATKIIGQFDENNDGVVTVSSSKFPEKLMAIDLGTIKADHLAGILSSRFNQKSFMKGLVTTLAELNISSHVNNFTWNSKVIIRAANASPIKTKTYYRLAESNLAKMYTLQGEHFVEFIPFSTTWELNMNLLPKINDPADNYEVRTKLPQSQLRFEPYNVLDVQKLPEILSTLRVTPATKNNMPEGIKIEYNHKNFVHFRMDHQFNYESRSPGGLDDNSEFGYTSSEFEGSGPWALMRSKNNSIRMTTLAYRFSPVEFSKMNLKLAVTKGVQGADPVKGKTGKDDSAFQVWFSVRHGRANNDRTTVDSKNDKVFLFGYYWGDPVSGENRRAGTIYENWYSNKNVVVATLPEAKQLLLNEQSMLGKAQTYERNLARDLKQAFPEKNLEDMEIVAITIQHDSNDAEDSSEAFFKLLSFTP